MPIAGAIALFCLTWLLGSWIAGPSTCRDGWQSSSIGTRGACSHHGGVYRNPLPLLMGALVGIGGYIGIKRYRLFIAEAGSLSATLKNRRREAGERSQIQARPCPVCGRMMQSTRCNVRALRPDAGF